MVAKSSPSRRLKPRYISLGLENPVDTINPYRVDVEFVNDLSIEQVVATINQLSNPQVITWYIGCHGLRSAGVQFYRDFLISPVLRDHGEAMFWLVLTSAIFFLTT
jgi:hypothetical protein